MYPVEKGNNLASYESEWDLALTAAARSFRIEGLLDFQMFALISRLATGHKTGMLICACDVLPLHNSMSRSLDECS